MQHAVASSRQVRRNVCRKQSTPGVCDITVRVDLSSTACLRRSGRSELSRLDDRRAAAMLSAGLLIRMAIARELCGRRTSVPWAVAPVALCVLLLTCGTTVA